MAIEILTVSLSEESLERLASAVAQKLVTIQHHVDGAKMVTQSNPPSAQTPQPAERSGFQQEDGPWANNAPQQGQTQQRQQQAPQNDQDGPPTCACGQPKRWVPPGFSQNSGKSYKGFWACPQPRGQQCPRS